MKRKNRKARIESMREEIRRRGGEIMINEEAPDELIETFLAQVLECPDCNSETSDPFGPKRTSHDH